MGRRRKVNEQGEPPQLHIELLTSGMLSLATPLVAAYLWPDQELSEAAGRAEANLRRLLAWPSAHLFLATLGAQGVGFAAVSWGFSTRQGQPFLWVQDLFTHPGYQRRGVARALLGRLVTFARAHGAQRLQLVTGARNLAARALYDALGFEWFDEKETYMLFL